MALLKDLIVTGASKFIGDAYFNIIKSGDWQGTPIDLTHGGTAGTTITNKILLSTDTSGTSAWSGFTINGEDNAAYNLATIASNASAGAEKTSNITSHLYIGPIDTTTTAALSDNGNVYLKLYEGDSPGELYLIKGGTGVNVTSDDNGTVIIASSLSIPETSIIPATVTPNLILMSTTTSGTAKWGNISDMSLTILDALDKILKPEEWLEVADLSNKSNYPIGTYAILILDNGTSDNYYSGVMMLGPATGRDAVDEVALHSAMATASDTTAPTRVYLGVNQSKLYMASQDGSDGASHKLTIKITRLI